MIFLLVLLSVYELRYPRCQVYLIATGDVVFNVKLRIRNYWVSNVKPSEVFCVYTNHILDTSADTNVFVALQQVFV